MANTDFPTRENGTGLEKTQVLQIAELNREPRLLTEQRLKGRRHYLETPLPHRAQHLWRYSDPMTFLPEGPAVPTDPSFQGPFPLAGADGAQVILMPGSPPVIAPGVEAVKAGVTVIPLALAEQTSALFGEAVPVDLGPFESYNAAVWSAGVFIRVPKETVLTEPLRIAHVAAPDTAATRVLISLEPGSRASIVEEHLGGAKGKKVFQVSELFLGNGARLDYGIVQRWDRGTVGHVTSRARLAAGAEIHTGVVSLGGAHYKLDVGALLDGPGARSEMVGVSYGDGRQQMDHHTVHHHLSGRSHSNLTFKSALNAKAASAYTGLIRIEPAAEHCEAYQECRNLLLSSRCSARSIPELEILNNEVACTHGATSGSVDKDQLFYLRSRGLTQNEALGLVVRGFFEEALRALPAPLGTQLATEVDERLNSIAPMGRPKEEAHEL